MMHILFADEWKWKWYGIATTTSRIVVELEVGTSSCEVVGKTNTREGRTIESRIVPGQNKCVQSTSQ